MKQSKNILNRDKKKKKKDKVFQSQTVNFQVIDAIF